MTQVIFDAQSIGYEVKPGDTITIHSPMVRGNGGVAIGTATFDVTWIDNTEAASWRL